jgi:hypothetical protein
MSRLLLVLLAALAMAVVGCGQKPGEDGANADSTVVADTTAAQSSDEIALEIAPLAVGQWVSYKVDTLSENVTLSVVAEEQFQGANCMWIQIEAPEGTMAQILVDPALMSAAFEQFGAVTNEVLADPQAYYATHNPDPQQMFSDTENVQKFMDFLSAIKIIKVMQNNAVVAYDISGVPAVLQPVLSDTAFMSQLTGGMTMEMQTPGSDSLQTLLNEVEFAIAEGQANLGGSNVTGQVITMTHPKGIMEILLSDDLPIIPLAYVRITETETGETRSVEVSGFGMQGAENKMPGAAVQTMDMAPMVQMMIQQAQAQAQGAQQQ